MINVAETIPAFYMKKEAWKDHNYDKGDCV